MEFTSLRFSGVRRLRILEMNAGSAQGTLPQSKTKRPHGLQRPWDCLLTRVAGSDKWALPIFELHLAHARTNGSIPSFVSPCLGRKWELGKAGTASYATTRRSLALLRVSLGGPDGEKYTLRPPKNSPPTAARRMNFAPRELNVIGNWSSGSRTNERYGRCVCANELLLRNATIQKVISGWAIVDSFCLAETVAGSDRIGKDPKTPTPELAPTPSGLPPITQTQESSGIEGASVEGVISADTCADTLPLETGTVRD